MIITVPVVETIIAEVKNYKPDYVGDYKVIAYATDNLTVEIEIQGD